MVRVAAKIISFAFHPLLLATYLILMLGIYFPALLMIPSQNLMLVTLIVFVFTFAFPVMYLLVYRWWSQAG